MKPQPDKLFHDKLNSFSKPAPPASWERIEAGLGKKNYSLIWWSVAASVSGLILCAYFLYRPASDHSVNIASSNENQKHKNGQSEIQIPAETESLNDEIREQEIIAVIPSEKKQSKKVKHNISKQEEIQIVSQEPAAKANVTVDEVSTEPIVEEDSIRHFKAPSQLAFKSPNRSENITIILTADQTREYLIAKSTPTEATSEPKKPSTFKKLLRKAADLKVNQDPFGELRQKKNEILALNFKTEKRGQKK
jgi:hypothetical protein